MRLQCKGVSALLCPKVSVSSPGLFKKHNIVALSNISPSFIRVFQSFSLDMSFMFSPVLKPDHFQRNACPLKPTDTDLWIIQAWQTSHPTQEMNQCAVYTDNLRVAFWTHTGLQSFEIILWWINEKPNKNSHTTTNTDLNVQDTPDHKNVRAIKQRPKSSYRPAVVLTACSHHLRSAGNVINKPIESTRHTSVHEISYRQLYLNKF